MGVKMSPGQIAADKVLRALAQAGDEYGDFSFLTFRGLMKRTALARPVVRRAARYLARKGYAKFGKGLWTEDGEPAGSGYAVTEDGVAFLARQGVA